MAGLHHFEKNVRSKNKILAVTIDHAEKVLEAYPLNAKALALLAGSQLNLGRNDEAIEKIQELLQIPGIGTQEYTESGEMYAQVPDFATSKMCHSKALFLDPQHTDARCGLAIMLSNLNGLELAKEHTKEVLNQDSQNLGG